MSAQPAAFEITVYFEGGDVEETIHLPSRFVVCDRCDGAGSHVNTAIDGNGLTADDFDQDPDFREDYMRGVYDVACEACGGLRVVKDIDYAALTPDEAHAAALWEEQEAERQQHAAWDRAAERMELAFGC